MHGACRHKDNFATEPFSHVGPDGGDKDWRVVGGTMSRCAGESAGQKASGKGWGRESEGGAGSGKGGPCLGREWEGVGQVVVKGGAGSGKGWGR